MKIAIIGAGMAGMVCAIKAAENKENQITIFERNAEPGKKILITGNGRCNLTNIDADNCGRYISKKPEFIKEFMNKHSYKDVIEFFEKLGLFIKEKNGGIYPLSNQASSVLTVLLNNINKPNITIKTEHYITDIEVLADKYIVDGQPFDSIVFACGGKAGVYKENEYNGYKLIKKLGINTEFFHPALCGCNCEGDYKVINGVRADASISLVSSTDDKVIHSEYGEVQFTEYGLSGIPVFNASLYIDKELLDTKPFITVDFIPELSENQLAAKINQILKENGNNTLISALGGIINTKLVSYILSLLKIPDKLLISKTEDSQIDAIVNKLKNLIFPVKNLREYKNAQVMVGGVSIDEIKTSFETQKYSNIYILGEMLDVTGECGGYNLNFAVGSGLTAGTELRDAR